MPTLLVLHQNLFRACNLFMLACGLWGLFNYFRNQGLGSSYSGALVIGELLLAVEAVIGVALLISGGVPGRLLIHILYGIVAVISLPALFFYTQGRTESKREALLYGLISLFLFGITLRAQTTGNPGAALLPFLLRLA